MEMPEINSCFGMFPPKYACFLISVFGLGTGGVGLAGIILYGLVEDSVIGHFVKTQKVDPGIKKLVLGVIGLTSLLLLVANTFLFLGFTFGGEGSVNTAKWITFTLCLILLFVGMGAALSCFFLKKTCVIKKISAPVMVLGYLTLAVFVSIWLYFTVIMYNYQIQL